MGPVGTTNQRDRRQEYKVHVWEAGHSDPHPPFTVTKYENLIVNSHYCCCFFSNTRSNNVHKRQSHVTHRNPQTNAGATTDSSSEGENRVLPLGKCKLNNEELLSSDGSSDLYRSSFFRPGPKLPLTFNRSTSIPTMPRSTSDLIAIGTIPITSQRQTPVKPMSR